VHFRTRIRTSQRPHEQEEKESAERIRQAFCQADGPPARLDIVAE
jgi:hypothetical protein